MPLGTGTSSVLSQTGRDLALADSANYYVAMNPTPGTGIIGGTATTLVQTTPLLIVYNAGLLTVYLTYLRLSNTVPATGAATRNFTHSIDQGNRLTGSAIAATAANQLTINNTNIMSNAKSSVQATFGAHTGAAAATVNARTLANDWFRVSLVDIVGDVYEWQFGSPTGIGVGSTPATVANFARSAPAIVLQPNSSYVLNEWASTNGTGTTFEVQLGFIEK
jgi:hypothetical protein